MHYGTEGRRAFSSFVACLCRFGKWMVPALILASMWIITPVQAAHKAQATARTAQRVEILNAATMKELEKQGAPSEQHRLLSSLAGKWAFDLKYWAKKDAEPQLSTGTATNEMVLGDRFLSSKIFAMLNFDGQVLPYQGWNILGYDTVTKSYTSVLLDTMRTGMAIGSAQYDGKLKTLKESGHFTFPLIGKERTYRSEIQLIDDNSYKQTVFIADGSGKEFKVLELDFRRPR
jgi:hypothetical protein